MPAYGVNLALKSERYSYNPSQGKRLVQTWQGTRDQAYIMALTLGSQCSWETDDSASPMVQLTASSPDNDDLQTQWGIRANQLSEHVYNALRTTEGVGTDAPVSDADLKKIQDYFAGRSNVEPTGLGYTADYLYYLMKHEQTSFILPRFVLHMRSVGTLANCFNSVIFDPDYVGVIMSGDQLRSGGVLDAAIHPSVQAYMRLIEAAFDTAPAGFMTGYLFQTPSLEPLPGGKHELRQEWYIGVWSEYAYRHVDATGAVAWTSFAPA